MENEDKRESLSFLEKTLSHKAVILIVIGFLIRIFMLLYYYYTHGINPSKPWGDVGINFRGTVHYPPLTMVILSLFKILSFGVIEVFAFWAFLFEILVVILFYYVLKSFKIPNIKYVYGLFLINPFLFLNNVFSYDNCGYHITDSFFFIFLFLALLYYPKDTKWSKYLFYLFIALSAAAKIYTLPIVGLFFVKFIIEKDWEEMKKFLICTVPIILIFLVSPIFFIENYIRLYFLWNEVGEVTLPLFIRIIPALAITGVFLVFRLKKADLVEITFVSILITAMFMFFSLPYVRYFQPILIFGILTIKNFVTFNLNLGVIKRKIKFDNNLLVFYSSFLLVAGAYLIIVFLL